MAQLHSYVSEAVKFFTGVAVLYFYLALVINLAQAQVSTSLGASSGYRDAIQQAFSMIFLLGLTVGSQAISDMVIGALAGTGSSTDSLLTAGEDLVRSVLAVVISGSVIFMVVMAVYTGFTAQIAHAAGSSADLANKVVNIIAIIGAGMVTYFSVSIANFIVHSFF